MDKIVELALQLDEAVGKGDNTAAAAIAAEQRKLVNAIVDAELAKQGLALAA